ncbi:putative gibberellin 3-beta-dioxygenase 3-like [Capsicum annuum]|uniref:probable 2-oxoglutarate-dependent dioxygenase AOP1 n=1 Tax=Capsicum annuum TaxID=4072 RepID=UPI001FB060E1|nr:probable 2-oxoglutarate-dependent dioxygenase AOP1 [Capsicum annuum]KAF3650905.1 putative gibberellin 3-beta-dioxygenase 3-like [Capsicum annuum]KAF3663663.1 putative gibberellin 3-beta-dioxygenase 3-like [Capsicum annuum]
MSSLSVPHKLPIIDFTIENLKPGTNSWSKARKEAVCALEEYGCFVALYDKISSKIHDDVFQALKELFDLPTQKKVQNKSSKPLYGYVGQIPFIPLYESMGIDNANTLEGIQNFTNFMWPSGNNPFSQAFLAYSEAAAELEEMVVKMVFESYGVEKYYETHVKSVNYLARVMKYREAQAEEAKLGFVAHTDKSFMSTIHQNQVNGLEIKGKDGQWFGVELSPSSIVVMAGDAITAWSNNRIKAPHHRVMKEEKGARYSIAQFSFMEDSFMVETPKELIDEEHPLLFKSFNHLDYLHFFSKEENRRLECALKTYCGV